MDTIKLSDLSERAVEVVDRAMSGEEIRVTNDVSRLVIAGGPQTTFPLDVEEDDDTGAFEAPELIDRLI